MKIDIDHIAKLAKLRIEESEKEKFTRQMEDMIDLVGQIPAIEGDMQNLDPSNPMRLREDKAKPSSSREEILQNAPSTQAGCIVVPKIMD